jgi:hypothetical protein
MVIFFYFLLTTRSVQVERNSNQLYIKFRNHKLRFCRFAESIFRFVKVEINCK